MLSIHLHLGLPSGLFPSGFRTNSHYNYLLQSSSTIYLKVKAINACSLTLSALGFSLMEEFRTRFERRTSRVHFQNITVSRICSTRRRRRKCREEYISVRYKVVTAISTNGTEENVRCYWESVIRNQLYP
jgi:hypothetical protein